MEPESNESAPKAGHAARQWWIALGIAITIALLADLSFLHWKVFFSLPSTPPREETSSVPVSSEQAPLQFCPTACLTAMKRATASVVLPTPYPVPTPVVIQQPVAEDSQREFFIPIGSGSTVKKTWTEISGAEVTIDTTNYPGKRTVTWEAALKVLSGNGTVHARLKNMSSGVWVTGTEITASADPAIQIQSGEFELAEGKVTYRVEMYTDTGYEATIESGRIKIVVE